MQHSQEIHLSERLIKSIVGSEAQSRTTLINELSNAKEIKSILEGYEYLNESKGQVHEYKILPDSIILKSGGEGSFKVTYAMEFFYACDAITTKHAQEMTITFKPNVETGTALFYGIDIPEREPDEL